MFRKLKKRYLYPIRWLIIKENIRRKKDLRTKREIDKELSSIMEQWLVAVRKEEKENIIRLQCQIDILNWVLYES